MCWASIISHVMADPLVNGKGCREEQVKALIDDTLERTQAYLPKMWF